MTVTIEENETKPLIKHLLVTCCVTRGDNASFVFYKDGCVEVKVRDSLTTTPGVGAMQISADDLPEVITALQKHLAWIRWYNEIR